jgi:hypothetical protein
VSRLLASTARTAADVGVHRADLQQPRVTRLAVRRDGGKSAEFVLI